jgi:outer membrane murein-binding lipoprotein Lpp
MTSKPSCLPITGDTSAIVALTPWAIVSAMASSRSMAAGEYVSVHSQADTERADLLREQTELETAPIAEHRESRCRLKKPKPPARPPARLIFVRFNDYTDPLCAAWHYLCCPHPLEIAMHASLKLILAALLVSSPLMASAVDEHHPEQNSTEPAQTSAPATPMQNKAMAEQMQKMQAAHDKVAAAKTPAERQAAMQESMKTMKDGMAMMQTNCNDMGMSGNKDSMGMGMMKMMMNMMDQQSSMMKMPMSK